MSTKTIRLPPRRVSMPSSNHHVSNSSSNSHKRKDRDGGFDLKPPLPKSPRPAPVQLGSPKPPVNSNHLLAGYFAYEFLTRGTLWGQMWDPARSQALYAGEASPKEEEAAAQPAVRAAEEGKHQRYAEIANLLKTSGTHLPGIVNPSGLARLLQM